MLRLVLTDIRLNALGFSVIFVLFNLLLDVMAATRLLYYRQTSGAGTGLFFASVMVLPYFSARKAMRDKLCIAACRQATIVTARYLSIFLVALGCRVYGLLFQGVILKLSPAHYPIQPTNQMDPGYAF